MRGYRSFPSKKITPDGITVSDEDLAIESILEIFFDKEIIAAFVCTPGLERELALGYLISTGIVSSAEDIASITLKNLRAKIKIREGATMATDRDFSQIRRFMSTECSAPEMLIELRTGGNIPEIKSKMNLDFKELAKASEEMREHQKIHKKTRGTHAALIGDPKRSKYFVVEDIGRRNAVDKSIGLALNDGTDLSKSYLFSTGRLTADVVSKCAWASIPLLASFAVTTDAGLKFAQKANITLVGQVRGNSCHLYHEGAARLIL